MDIRSGSTYPSKALSNFAPHPFVFDGVECSSMEGFLQSLKFDKPHIQVEVCKLVGRAAKSRGSQRNNAWKRNHHLWWKGFSYDRFSITYQELIGSAYKSLTEQNESFRKALLATGNANLTHSIGRNNPKETILTEREFCSFLTEMREYAKDLENES